MPGIEDLLKLVDLKKPNWPALAIITVVLVYKLLATDPCSENNKYLQKELDDYRGAFLEQKKVILNYQKSDSNFHQKAVNPAKAIVDQKNHEK